MITEEQKERQREDDACEPAWNRIRAATYSEESGELAAVLGLTMTVGTRALCLSLSETVSAIQLLWRTRLLSARDLAAVADRYVLAVERAKAEMRRRLA